MLVSASCPAHLPTLEGPTSGTAGSFLKGRSRVEVSGGLGGLYLRTSAQRSASLELTEVDDTRTEVSPRCDNLLRRGTLIVALSRVLLHVLGAAVKDEAGVGWTGVRLPSANGVGC